MDLPQPILPANTSQAAQVLTLAGPNPVPTGPEGPGKPPIRAIGGGGESIRFSQGAGTLGVLDGGQAHLGAVVLAVLTSH